MTDERVLRTLRAQAWARAKGEIDAMLNTYWSETTDKYREVDKVTRDFIKEMEDRGLAE